MIFNHADLLFRSSLPRFAQTFICTLLYSYLSLLMCSFAKKSIFKYPFLTLFLLTLPTVFLLLPPPFLSLPLSGKSHGFPEVERHKAWSAGGSLPSFIFMLCLSSPLIGWDSVMWHFVPVWGKITRCIYAARIKTLSSVSQCRLFGIKWRVLHFHRDVCGR